MKRKLSLFQRIRKFFGYKYLQTGGEPSVYLIDEIGQFPGHIPPFQYIAGFDDYKEDGESPVVVVWRNPNYKKDDRQ